MRASRAGAFSIALLALCLALGVGARARAEPCKVVDYRPRAQTGDGLRSEARAAIADEHFDRARAIYEALLKDEPASYELRFALARVSAWDRCFARATRLYEELLRENPNDTDVLPLYIDVLLWSKRPRDAERELARGFSIAPNSAELWLRKARIQYWQGERDAAVRSADRAESLSPNDLDIRQFRDGFYRTQVRATTQLTRYPKNYRDLWVASLLLQQYLRRLELNAEAQLIAHANGKRDERLVNGLYTLSAFYHTRYRISFGGGVGVGAPSPSVPRLKLKPSAFLQLTTQVYLALNYEFWRYRAAHEDPVPIPRIRADESTIRQDAHVLRPALGYAITEQWTLELRPVLMRVKLTQDYAVDALPELGMPALAGSSTHRKHVAGAGVRASYRPSVYFGCGAGYTYGPQVERAQGYEFLSLRSHIVNATVDWMFARHSGVQPSFTFEHRESDAGGAPVDLYTFELASYFRW